MKKYWSTRQLNMMRYGYQTWGTDGEIKKGLKISFYCPFKQISSRGKVHHYLQHAG
jgi:hypothetical protein